VKGRPLAVVALMLSIVACACERESRPVDKLTGATSQKETPTSLYAGPMPPMPPDISPFQQNAWGMAEGKRLFTAYNCSGCHGNGGGGMGPALMDDKWIYGSQPINIFGSIVEGRPNGMPSWRNKIPDAQVWQLVAYVQSLSGQAPQTAMPGRSDHMRSSPPENNRPARKPVPTGTP
jgi:cytochrome c oxidase cbb3-type subunit III